MTRKILLVAAASGCALLGSAAMAEEFRPLSQSLTLSGYVTMEADMIAACMVTIALSIDNSGNAVMTGSSSAPGHAFCGFSTGPTGTWTLSPGPGTSTVSMNISFQLIGWGCVGAVQADFDNTTGNLVFDNVTVPGDRGVTCVLNGKLGSSPQMSIIP